jgi:thioredoxin 1
MRRTAAAASTSFFLLAGPALLAGCSPAESPKLMHVNTITGGSFEQEVLKAKEPVMVYFSADWCGPCRQLAPHIDAMAADNKDKLKVVKIDVDHNKSLTRQYGVAAVPTIVFFKDGKVIARNTGYMSLPELQSVAKCNIGTTAAKAAHTPAQP